MKRASLYDVSNSGLLSTYTWPERRKFDATPGHSAVPLSVKTGEHLLPLMADCLPGVLSGATRGGGSSAVVINSSEGDNPQCQTVQQKMRRSVRRHLDFV